METAVKIEREEAIAAFNLMWGGFPSPVMLITYQHEIVAVNRMCAELGTPLGVKCFSFGGNHSGCKAAQAKKTGKAVRSVAYNSGHNIVYDGYWIPVGGEYIVHFGNDITEYVDAERFKNEAAQ